MKFVLQNPVGCWLWVFSIQLMTTNWLWIVEILQFVECWLQLDECWLQFIECWLQFDWMLIAVYWMLMQLDECWLQFIECWLQIFILFLYKHINKNKRYTMSWSSFITNQISRKGSVTTTKREVPKCCQRLIVYLMLLGSSRPYPWFILEENGR